MLNRNMTHPCKKVRYFHVVGGGCFGSQYLRWLLRARDRGKLQFEKIFAVDRDPNCRLSQEGTDLASVQLVNADWVDYLAKLLLSEAAEGRAAEDHWVPSPLSPH